MSVSPPGASPSPPNPADNQPPQPTPAQTTANSRTIEVPVGGADIVEFQLSQLAEGLGEVHEIIGVLSENNADADKWAVCVLELVRLDRLEPAEMMLTKGLEAKVKRKDFKGQVPLLLILANLTLRKARAAPKVVAPTARFDKLPADTPTKAYYLGVAQQMVVQAQELQAKVGEPLDSVGYLSRAVLELGQGQPDLALRDLDQVLADQPHNLVALLCKARILYTKRDPASALTIFQFVLAQDPTCRPDPRVGIGLCYWVLGSRAQAKSAWRRSLELDPTNWPAELLLGLERVNHAKLPVTPLPDRQSALRDGLQRVGQAFRHSGQTSAAAAIALSTSFATENGDYEQALKLAERATAYADTRAHFLGGLNAMARVHHMQSDASSAQTLYDLASAESKQGSLLADLGAGQMQLLRGEFLQAKHTFEGIAKRWPNEPEVQATFAALLAHDHPGLSEAERLADRARARATFDKVQLMLDADHAAAASALGVDELPPPPMMSRDVGLDEDLYVDMAKAYHGESLERSAKAYRSAVRARTDAGRPDSPALLSNLGALAMLDGDLSTAQDLFQEALTKAAGLQGAGIDRQKTTILYNLGRAYEGLGKLDEADEAYRQILTVHPEYPEAKIRLAAMALNAQQLDAANNHLKDALTAHPANTELRAFYLYFLVQTASTLAFNAGALKTAIEFAYNTLREHRSDVYTLCAAGWLNYRQGREMKPPANAPQDGGAALGRERTKYYARSAELFEKALVVDPECSFAAQSLAIAVAENALALPGAPTNDDSRTRVANARQALGVFQRVRETLMDGSVYVNMGHCYFANDEFERAIESYETALQRFYNGVDWATSLYLARTWYSKANRDGNFSAMQLALRYAQKALHLQPHDKAILFNIAMIQQKAAEMLVALNVERRTCAELDDGFKHANHAQKIFQSLAQDRSRNLPYDPRLADQRFRYGQSILRRAPAELEKQKAWESTEKTQLEAAIKKRADEKAELARKEEERMVEIRKQADEVKAARLAKQQEVASWVIPEVDDYERKPSGGKKRKKAKAADGSEAEGFSSGVEEDEVERPKKKKSKPKKKYVDPDDDGDAPMASDGDDGEKKAKSKPKKKTPARKKAILDEDDEAVEKAPKRGSGKKYISKETISDSDEED